MNYQFNPKDVSVVSRWLAKRVATSLPAEAAEMFAALRARPSISGYEKFIDLWIDQADQERLYTTIRVARHRRESPRKKNLAICQEAYDLLERRSKKLGFKSVTAYVEHYAIGVWR